MKFVGILLCCFYKCIRWLQYNHSHLLLHEMLFKVLFMSLIISGVDSHCPFIGNNSYKYEYAGVCYQLMQRSNIPEWKTDNLFTSLNNFCNNLKLGWQFATLIVPEENRLPPISLWSEKHHNVTIFTGVQIELGSSRQAFDSIIVYQPDSSARKIALTQFLRKSHDKISLDVDKTLLLDNQNENLLFCPVIKVDSLAKKYILQMVLCSAGTPWQLFVCKYDPRDVASQVFGSCVYDHVAEKCFIQSVAASENNGTKSTDDNDNKRTVCHCATCDVGSWSEWGPWNSSCGHVKRYRLKPKDGETVGSCIRNQKRCCVEMQIAQLPPCLPSEVQSAHLNLDCFNGGIPVFIGPDNIVCSCPRPFIGTFCEKRKISVMKEKNRLRLYPAKRTKRRVPWAPIQLCEPNPCYNNGICFEMNGDYECYCQPGYGGTKCKFKTTLCSKTKRCLNNGVCYTEDGEEKCHCLRSFTGPLCEMHILQLDCSSANCKYGMCTSTPQHAFVCKCNKGYQGAYCMEDVNECIMNPCQNGGVCKNLIGTYSCSCSTPFTGTHCEIDGSTPPDACTSNPCSMGVCQNVGTGYICRCDVGYTGKQCNMDINECISQPCLNGGKCHNEVGRYSCTCVAGYYGDQCEFVFEPLRKHQSTENSSDFAVPVIILLLLVSVGVVALIYFTYEDRSRKAKLEADKSPEPSDNSQSKSERGEKPRRRTMQMIADFLQALKGSRYSRNESASSDDVESDAKKRVREPRSGERQGSEKESLGKKHILPSSERKKVIKKLPAKSPRKPQEERGLANQRGEKSPRLPKTDMSPISPREKVMRPYSREALRESQRRKKEKDLAKSAKKYHRDPYK